MIKPIAYNMLIYESNDFLDLRGCTAVIEVKTHPRLAQTEERVQDSIL
ncbi:hypothetical protein M1N92_03130 [Dehalococcoidia bacterium]|nr:hypothetical protein [Dehalococcoidia bacterium]